MIIAKFCFVLKVIPKNVKLDHCPNTLMSFSYKKNI